MHTVTWNIEAAIRKQNKTNNRHSVFLSRLYNACMNAYQVQLHLWHQWQALLEILVALEAVPIIWHNEKELQLYSKGRLFMCIKGTLYLLIYIYFIGNERYNRLYMYFFKILMSQMMFNLFTWTAWGTSQSSKQILQLEDYLRLRIKIKNWHLFSEWDVTRQSACPQVKMLFTSS